MSLATASAGAGLGGGAAGGGGLAMAAHGAGRNAMASHRAHAQPPPGTGHAGPSAATAAPSNLAALGADLLDKTQTVSSKSVRNAADRPIVAVDLYGRDGGDNVAYFPPAASSSSSSAENGEGGGGGSSGSGANPIRVSTVGSVSTSVTLKKNDDASHRAVRKLLSRGVGYDAVLSSAVVVATPAPAKKDGKDGGAAEVVTIPRPHLLLGARRTSHLPPAILDGYDVVDDAPSSSSTATAVAIDEDVVDGVAVRNGTLDGSPTGPKGDDFDRVVFGLKLHENKKPLTVLPEEATGIALANAKKEADVAWRRSDPTVGEIDDEDGGDGDAEEEEEGYVDHPLAIPVPGWACLDSSIESLLDATGGNAVLYQRPLAALAGSLLPRFDDKGKVAPHKLMSLLNADMQTTMKERRKAAQRAGRGNDDDAVEPYSPLLVLAGLTPHGLELTAVEVGTTQMEEPHCVFGDYRVVSNVSYCHAKPLTILEKALKELRTNVRKINPESCEPVGILTYGNLHDQIQTKSQLEKILKSFESSSSSASATGGDNDDDDDDECEGWDTSVPFLSSHENAISTGAAVLGAVSHGRLRVHSNDGAKGKRGGKMGIRIENVSPIAVGVRRNYFGDDASKWSAVKTIFDFDRRVPAGPYGLDLKASECVAHRESIRESGQALTDEEADEKGKQYEGSKTIPEREEASLDLRIQIVQKRQRDGEWIPVGDPMKPLCKEDDPEVDDEEKKRSAVERVVLELSLGATGLISTSMVSDWESVVQATKSARNSKIRYYVGVLFAILFFGGFLVKSYVEQAVFDRDVKRLLAYYKHVVPNSMMDGDEHNARYLVWKYKGKKAKLWRRLEAKYGEKVLLAHEWPEEEEEETVDLDDKEREEEKDEGGEDGMGGEPDL